MLQGVQAEIGHVGRFGVAEDAENAALVFEFVHQAIFFAKYDSIAADHARSASSIDTSIVTRPPAAIAQPVPACPTDDTGRDARRRRLLQHPGHVLRRNGNDDPRGRFAEQRGRVVETPVAARPRPPQSRSPLRSPRPSKQHSASVTAMPPSEQSSADRTSRLSASATRSACSARSRSRSSAGGTPRT